jgi:hypothetical protein
MYNNFILGLRKNSANRNLSLTNLNRQAKFWRNFIIIKHDGKAGILQKNMCVFQACLIGLEIFCLYLSGSVQRRKLASCAFGNGHSARTKGGEIID